MGDAIAASEFRDYANAQVAAAEAIIRHHRFEGVTCSCGRAEPCPVVAACLARRDHFVQKPGAA